MAAGSLDQRYIGRLCIGQFQSTLEAKEALRSLARIFSNMEYEPEPDVWLAGKWELHLEVSQARKGWWVIVADLMSTTEEF